MPLPLFLGIAAAFAGLTGTGAGIHGAVKMKEANDTMKSAEIRHKRNLQRFENTNKATSESMDNLGKKEIEILSSFKTFSNLIEKIQNKPEFKDIRIGLSLPQYDHEELKKVSIGAGVLMGGIGGAALGTAGGFAAAGATTAAVMALGTASTGTAIASLSGVAATNATLAALGGGAIAAGGGGIALGTTMLGVTTLGVGLLVGGIIFSITGSSISSKADEAWSQMRKAEKEIDKICSYLGELKTAANTYLSALQSIDKVYQNHLNSLNTIVMTNNKVDWNAFTDEEQTITENTVVLVQLLYKMCKLNLVIKSDAAENINKINATGIEENLDLADRFLKENSLSSNATTHKSDDSAVREPEITVPDYSEKENVCLATAALLFFIARCDNVVTDEEHRIIHETIDSITDSFKLSPEAEEELERIRYASISFKQVRRYLDKIPSYILIELKKYTNELSDANCYLSPAERVARDQFFEYLHERECEDCK